MRFQDSTLYCIYIVHCLTVSQGIPVYSRVLPLRQFDSVCFGIYGVAACRTVRATVHDFLDIKTTLGIASIVPIDYCLQIGFHLSRIDILPCAVHRCTVYRVGPRLMVRIHFLQIFVYF